ncbi:MAG: MIP/aquaporin family protein [Rothia sp. (in: high G+C Gram-positive bacteria)]|nr:MIP/aquaporin family protein [Rothia sp. (in: high G+C Gram-positive bacteria)]
MLEGDLQLYCAELVGTAMLLFMGLSVIANISLKASGMFGSGGLAAALGWGSAMTATAVVVGPISGAHVNPAFTLGFWLSGALPTRLVPGYILAQIAGAVLGTLLVWLLYKDHLDLEQEAATKRGVFVTEPSLANFWRNILAEATATFALMLVVLSLGKHGMPAGIGLLHVYIGLSGGVMAFGGLTGYAINPVRDLVPRLMYSLLPIRGKGQAQWSYALVPVLGPCLGAACAAGVAFILGTPAGVA